MIVSLFNFIMAKSLCYKLFHAFKFIFILSINCFLWEIHSDFRPFQLTWYVLLLSLYLMYFSCFYCFRLLYNLFFSYHIPIPFKFILSIGLCYSSHRHHFKYTFILYFIVCTLFKALIVSEIRAYLALLSIHTCYCLSWNALNYR